MHTSHAQVATANPARLIKRLCNHWRHKFPVQVDEQGGEIELPLGQCSLQVSPAGLQARLQSPDPEQLQRMQTVVAEHLQRMAGDESLGIAWLSGPA